MTNSNPDRPNGEGTDDTSHARPPAPEAPAPVRAGVKLPPVVGNNRLGLAVAALLATYYFLGLSAVSQKSITFDETAHLAQGCLRWLQPEYRFPAMNGVVAQRLAGLPSVLAGIKAPDMQASPMRERGQFTQACAIFYDSGNDFPAMLLRGRAAVALLGVACGFLTFRWARTLFGAAGGLLALTLYVFSPFTLANGPLVTADMAASFGFLAATFAFWKVVHRVTWGSVLASCAALPLLLLSKTSGVLIGPIFVLIAFVRTVFGPPISVELNKGNRLELCSPGKRMLGLVALVALHLAVLIPTLWFFYDFRTLDEGLDPATISVPHSPSAHLTAGTQLKSWVIEAITGTGLLPDAFKEALRSTLLAADMRSAFMAGRYSLEGFGWFFPFAFLVKTPVGVLGLLCTAAIALTVARDRTTRRTSLYETAPLLILLGVYGVSAVTSKLNIGIRHILPMYAPLLILAGANVRWLVAGARWARWGVLTLTASVIAAGLVSYPHYLAFFNLPSGGSAKGYRLLVDSSLDWGQDLPTLKRWLDRHKRADEDVYFSYFGTGLPEFYGIDARWLPRFFDWGPQTLDPLRGGLYCISATMLSNVYSPFIGPWCERFEQEYQRTRAEVERLQATRGVPADTARLIDQEGRDYWEKQFAIYRQLRFIRLCSALQKRRPDADAGHSILIFRLTDDEVARYLDGPPAELNRNTGEPLRH